MAADADTEGPVFSAFSWSYALLQIPGGIFLDKFRTRFTYFIAIAFWSLFTALMGVRSSLRLILTRVGIGIFEAPCFPRTAGARDGFPHQERARANSVYIARHELRWAFLSVPLFWLTQQFGWRGLFLIVGASASSCFSFIGGRSTPPSEHKT